MPNLDRFDTSSLATDQGPEPAEPENNEYVRMALQRCMAEVALLGGTRHTPLLRNRYCDVLIGLDALIDECVPE